MKSVEQTLIRFYFFFSMVFLFEVEIKELENDSVVKVSLLTGNIEKQRNARSCTFQVDISARVHLFSCLKFRYYSA